MKAIVHREYGPPEVLRVEEVETPTPGDKDVLIRVRATSVNFGDTFARNFKAVTPWAFTMPAILWLPTRLTFGVRRPRNPILGSEYAGDVEAVGSAVTRFKPGDAVFGYRAQKMRANAEYVCIPESELIAHKPENMSYEEACTVPYGALTAMNLLKKVDLGPGKKILINGASGAIGSFALQLAKHTGAEVTGVAGGPRQDFMRALGADHVIDYTKENFTQNGETYDVIFDVKRKTSFGRCKGSLAADGVYLLASFKFTQLYQMMWTKLRGGKRVVCALSMESQGDLQAIKEMMDAGAIGTVVDKTFPMDEAAAAHRYVESGEKRGHVVITMA